MNPTQRLIVVAVTGLILARIATAQTHHAPTTNVYDLDREVYPLDPGPHLFLDWRYIDPGHIQWQSPQGQAASKEGRGLTPEKDLERKIAGRDTYVPHGIRIDAQVARKIGPIFSSDQPWEHRYTYPSLLLIDGKYRLYYEVEPPPGHKEIRGKVLCVAESTDGKQWTKPQLGLVEFGGSKANNIVYGGSLCRWDFQGNSVFYDPSAPPEARYKVVYMAGVPPEVIEKLRAESPDSVSPGGAFGHPLRMVILSGVSPDGIHWKENERPLMAHVSDTQTTVYYDQTLKRYVGYLRSRAFDRRAIARTETTDFGRWPAPQTILWPNLSDEPSDDYYVNGKALYPGTISQHMFFTSVYKRDVDSTTLRLASSIDGRIWNWVPGPDLMKPGPDGEWDGGYFFVGVGLTEMPDGNVVLPFIASRLPHKFPRFMTLGSVGLAAWPRERITALVADQEGEFYTLPMRCSGDSLYLNFETRRAGYVQVELINKGGDTVARSGPLVGNQGKLNVTWSDGGSTSLKSDTVRLHFRMKAARLYSFEVR